MINKIAQKTLGYCAATALCLAGAVYLGVEAHKKPAVPREIAYVNAIQTSLSTEGLRDISMQEALNKNKIRFEKIKANPELAPYVNNLETILADLPDEYLTSTENDLYNRANEIIQRELKEIRNDYDSPDKARYAGAAVGMGVLAVSLAGLGCLDISHQKEEEKKKKEFWSKVYRFKPEKNKEPIVFVDYNSKK